MTEPAILHHSFDLLCAFDEVVSLGYKENVSLSQVRSVLEGESHEEKIQEIIARNKEAEAKEELKRRAKQLEMQRREQQRIAQAGRHGSGMGMAGGYNSVPSAPRFEAPVPEYRTPSPAPVPSKPVFKGSGMKLGKKGKQNDLISQLGYEAELQPEPEPEPEPEVEVAAVSADVLDQVEKEDIHVTIKEQLSVVLLRAGGLQSFELHGHLDVRISDPEYAKLRLTLAPNDYSHLQLKQHTNVAKFAPSGPKVIALKDPARPFPVGQELGVLRWRMTSNDESKVPLTVTVWPQPCGEGQCDVAVEYELEASNLTLRNVVISIPIPPSALPVVTGDDANWTADRGAFVWTIDEISADAPTNSIEFRCDGDEDAFFPVNVGFAAAGSLANLDVSAAEIIDGGEASFSLEKILTVNQYQIV